MPHWKDKQQYRPSTDARHGHPSQRSGSETVPGSGFRVPGSVLRAARGFRVSGAAPVFGGVAFVVHGRIAGNSRAGGLLHIW